jgi:phage terminase small subunit
MAVVKRSHRAARVGRDEARAAQPASRRRDGLREREQRFIDEYLVDLNATQAAIRAGYSAKSARSIGAENLTKPHIAPAIAAALEARAVRTGITQDRVLEELAALAFSDVTHYRVTDAGEVALAAEAPASAMRAVQSIKRRITTRHRSDHTETVREVEIRLWDKPGPLKLAGQHVGLFADRVEHSGKITLLEEALAASRHGSEHTDA